MKPAAFIVSAALLIGLAVSIANSAPIGRIKPSELSVHPPTVADTPVRPNVNFIYSFQGSANGDGANPQSALFVSKGTVYGTTVNGGAACSCGAIFQINASGQETVLYRFAGGLDGTNPVGGLTSLNGTMYGTTQYGGAASGNGCGTAFAVGGSAGETVLHRFACTNTDGAYPIATLLPFGGALWGTTYEGGEHGRGTVFTLSPSGNETIVHSFKGGGHCLCDVEGGYPYGSLVRVGAKLYGVTEFGGGTRCFGMGGPSGCGTVYEVEPHSGRVRTIYRFTGGSDGDFPQGALADIGGTLYGTTFGGGLNTCKIGNVGCGTVFSVTTSGQESVLYRFASGSGDDGFNPTGGLVTANGELYGTTEYGGLECFSVSNGRGCGTLFQVSPSGSEGLIYAFSLPGEGIYPIGGLTYSNQTLYGTTSQGGNSCSCGAMFTQPI